MTNEILISKTIGAHYFFCDRPVLQRKPERQDLITNGEHLILFINRKKVLRNTFIYNTQKF